MRLLKRFFPKQPPLPLKEKLLSGMTAFLGIALLSLLKEQYPAEFTHMILASMGATAVLLFAAPHSTLVQPSAILGGHFLSAVVGVAAQQWVPAPYAAAAAVGGAILLMHLAHCLHPPGGATAIFAVIGGPPVWDLGYGYVLSPVGVNAVLMLLLGMIINNLRSHSTVYPAPLADEIPKPTPNANPVSVTLGDIQQALASSETYLDVSEEDLWALYQKADLLAHRRLLSNHPISALTLEPPETLHYTDTLDEVWEALMRSRDGSVVIVSAFQHLDGIITRSDLIKYLHRLERPIAMIQRIRRQRITELLASERTVAGEIMTHPVVSVPMNATLDQVAAILAKGKLHHVPVVDDRRRLMGVITHAHLWSLLDLKLSSGPS
jgi:CBS domain-containing membrane protein